MGKYLATIALGLTLASLYAVKSAAAAAGAGNTGGNCYNLQIIALKDKSADMTGTSGHALFIGLNKNTKINLTDGPFSVIDRNGTDGVASFSLPAPDPTLSGISSYSVYMRVVGKPGSQIDMTTCAYDTAGELFCNAEENSISMSRIAGTSRFTNVSKQLLALQVDLDGDGELTYLPLFDSRLQDYFWDVDSQGRAHAQLRFCPIQSSLL
jgi:hypothetical protein